MSTPKPRVALSAAVALSIATTVPLDAQSQGAGGLEEIIVTAQRRAQSIQEVPIAITALDAEMLEANRVMDITDLSSLAPGFWVAPSAGSSQIPQLSMRGATGNGAVPGSDRQISLYLDGVYLSSPRGAIFDLPDLERIEVLRGPQGTLFGRNSTAGAVSITTRDPTGEAGVKARLSAGNYDHHRVNVSIDLPQVGPFSGYLSYVNDSRDGDVRNTAAGQSWDRRNSAIKSIAKVEKSPKYLGSEDNESWFAAVKFEMGEFVTVYKFDQLNGEGTPRATGVVGYDSNAPLVGNLLKTLVESQPYPVPVTADGRRPDSVANGFAVPTYQDVEGHSLTSTWQISDNLSIKNILAYREGFVFGANPLDGLSSLTLTPEAVGPFATLVAFSTIPGLAQLPPATQGAIIGQVASGLQPFIGSPYVGIVNQAHGRNRQTSEELQFNYDSDILTATAGLLWFNAKDWTNEHQFQNSPSFIPIPGGVVQNANIGTTFNEITSKAAYSQLEVHLTPHLDLVAGARITRDEKTGRFTYGPTPDNLSVQNAKFSETKPNYLLGFNYRPNNDTMFYGKYSTAYVSGGSTAGVPFDSEEAVSWEAGIKADLLDNRLRTNLALFHVEYEHVQGSQFPGTPGMPEYIIEVTGNPDLPAVIGTLVGDLGTIESKGFELEVSAAPSPGLGMGGTLGFNDTKFTDVNEALRLSAGGRYEHIFRPEWTGSVWAQYETSPSANGNVYLSLRLDGLWQSDINLAQNPDAAAYQSFAAGVQEIPSHWIVNSRATLHNLQLGSTSAQLSLWGRNLTDEDAANYGLNLGVVAAANYISARTFGLDLTVEF